MSTEPTHVAAYIVAEMRRLKTMAEEAAGVTADDFDALMQTYDELAVKFNALPAHERDEALR